MSGDIKKYIYIIGTICIVFVVGSMIIKLLPWLILIGLITYVCVKITGKIKRKNKVNSSENMKNNNSNEYNYNASTTNDDYISGEVIDVEFEDVDNTKK